MDIRIKLQQWGVEAGQIQVIIDSLVKDKFIDEARYANAFAREKARFNNWGPRKIGTALRAKRIPDEYVSTALSEIEQFVSADKLSELIAKKAQTISYKDNYDLKNKLLRFGVMRGFEYGEVLSVVEKLI